MTFCEFLGSNSTRKKTGTRHSFSLRSHRLTKRTEHIRVEICLDCKSFEMGMKVFSQGNGSSLQIPRPICYYRNSATVFIGHWGGCDADSLEGNTLDSLIQVKGSPRELPSNLQHWRRHLRHQQNRYSSLIYQTHRKSASTLFIGAANDSYSLYNSVGLLRSCVCLKFESPCHWVCC
jgi:hypothetical protein